MSLLGLGKIQCRHFVRSNQKSKSLPLYDLEEHIQAVTLAPSHLTGLEHFNSQSHIHEGDNGCNLERIPPLHLAIHLYWPCYTFTFFWTHLTWVKEEKSLWAYFTNQLKTLPNQNKLTRNVFHCCLFSEMEPGLTGVPTRDKGEKNLLHKFSVDAERCVFLCAWKGWLKTVWLCGQSRHLIMGFYVFLCLPGRRILCKSMTLAIWKNYWFFELNSHKVKQNLV